MESRTSLSLFLPAFFLVFSLCTNLSFTSTLESEPKQVINKFSKYTTRFFFSIPSFKPLSRRLLLLMEWSIFSAIWWLRRLFSLAALSDCYPAWSLTIPLVPEHGGSEERQVHRSAQLRCAGACYFRVRPYKTSSCGQRQCERPVAAAEAFFACCPLRSQSHLKPQHSFCIGAGWKWREAVPLEHPAEMHRRTLCLGPPL